MHILIFLYTLVLSLSFHPASSHPVRAVEQPVITSVPTALFIPSHRISLPIVEAQIENNQWQITDGKTAFFGSTSSLPGKPGTTVIFAHAKTGLFAMLPKIKLGSTVTLRSGDTYYVYRIEQAKTVKDTDVSFLQNTGENRLVLLTCFGKKNEFRLLLFGSLSEKTKVGSIDKNLYYL